MDGPSMDTSSIIGLLVWFACVLYSSIKSTTNSQAARITMTDTVRSNILNHIYNRNSPARFT